MKNVHKRMEQFAENRLYPVNLFFYDCDLPMILKKIHGKEVVVDEKSKRIEEGVETVFVTYFEGAKPMLSTRVPVSNLYLFKAIYRHNPYCGQFLSLLDGQECFVQENNGRKFHDNIKRFFARFEKTSAYLPLETLEKI